MMYKLKLPSGTIPFVGCFAFFGFLQLIYISIIQPIWEYSGFVGDFNLRRNILSWIFFIPVAFIVAKTSKNMKLSWIIVSIILLCAYAPTLVLYIYTETRFIYLVVIYYFVLMSALIISSRVDFTKLARINNNIILNLFGTFLSLIIIFIWARYAHFHIQLSLLDVYSQREEATSYAIPIIFRYIFSMSKSVIPLLVVFSLYEKRYKKAFFYLIVQYLGFCIDASKSAIFMCFIAIFMFYIIKRIKNYTSVIPWIMSTGILAAFVENRILNTIYISGVLYRRVLFVPALLNYDYFNYFSENVFDYYRGSISLLGESPYIIGIPYIIGDFNGSGAAANNGLFSDAYANLGVAGMIIMPIMLIIILKILEIISKGLLPEVTVSVVVMVSITLISSSFFTNLLSHGILLTMVTLLLIPKQNKSHCDQRIITRVKLRKIKTIKTMKRFRCFY